MARNLNRTSRFFIAYLSCLVESQSRADREIQIASVSADSLSKQLKVANSRLSSASYKAKTEYVEIESNVLRYCVREYTKRAERADAERIDKEKLIEAWPSE